VFNRNDFIVGIASILLGLFIVMQGEMIENEVVVSIDPAGPTALPDLMAYIIIAIGVIHLGGAWYANKAFAGKHQSKKIQEYVREYKAVIYSSIVSILYAMFLENVGYLILTPLLISALLWIVQVRKIKDLVKVSVTMTVILYVVFALGLKVKLPLGLLEIFGARGL